MTDFSVEFLGCKISQVDAESIREALLVAGHVEGDLARVRVVNTCCITAQAEKKSRKRVRQLLASSDDVQVFVTGCGATLRPEAYGQLGEQVTALPGTASLAAATIVRAADQLAGLGCKGSVLEPASGVARSRAFVKVQDGCSFGCSYCIVPTVRGDTRSRAFNAVLADVAKRVVRGQREIVLTGINIGLYRDDETRAGLDRLLLAVADVEGVTRVRISSIEVNHVNRRLVQAMASHPKICPHLHVPLQSGDDGVLGDMRRHYDSARYLRAIERAREALPCLNLTTDVIVGYPTESDDAFANTMAVAQTAGFTKVHAFPFSARPGTDAAALPAVAPVVVRERSRLLRAQADLLARARWAGRVGGEDEVVVEMRRADGATMTDGHEAADGATPRDRSGGGGGQGGYTRDYLPVRLLPGGFDVQNGDLVQVRLDGVEDAGLVAGVSRIIAPALSVG